MPDGYDDDFYLWTQDQARRLRAAGKLASNLGVDWNHVAEEIESLGSSQKRELQSRLRIILEHLLKLSCSPATQPWKGWAGTVLTQRREVGALLDDMPSLRPLVAGFVADLSPRARRDTAREMDLYGEEAAARAVREGCCQEIEARVLDEDFLPHPPPAPTAG